jgi:hypothetical protein
MAASCALPIGAESDFLFCMKLFPFLLIRLATASAQTGTTEWLAQGLQQAVAGLASEILRQPLQ